MEENQDKEVVGLKQYVVYCLRRWKVFIVAFVISLIVAILYLVLYPRTYEVYSSIQLQEEGDLGSGASMLGEAAGLMKSFGLGGGGGSGLNVDDELEILTSSELLSKVALNLGVNVEYSKPYSFHKFYNNAPYKVTANKDFFNSLNSDIQVKVRKKNGAYQLVLKEDKKKKKLTVQSLPAQVETKQGTFTLSAVPESEANDKSLDITISPPRWTAEALQDEFVIEEASKTSNVIEIIYTDHERERGTDLIRELTNLYNKRSYEVKKKNSGISLDFINSRIDSIKIELEDFEKQIELFKTQHQLTDLTTDVQFYSEQMKNLETLILDLQSQQYMMDILDDFIKDPDNKYRPVPSVMHGKEGEKTGTAISDYNEALVERSSLMMTSMGDNFAIRQSTQKADQLREAVFLTIDNAKKTLDLSLKDLRDKEQQILSKVKGVPSYERTYTDIRRQQEITQGLYLLMLQKREELALTIGDHKAKAEIVNQPYIKKKPIAPRKLYAVVIIMLLTLIIPIGIFIVQNMYQSIKEELAKEE